MRYEYDRYDKVPDDATLLSTARGEKTCGGLLVGRL